MEPYIDKLRELHAKFKENPTDTNRDKLINILVAIIADVVLKEKL